MEEEGGEEDRECDGRISVRGGERRTTAEKIEPVGNC